MAPKDGGNKKSKYLINLTNILRGKLIIILISNLKKFKLISKDCFDVYLAKASKNHLKVKKILLLSIKSLRNLIFSLRNFFFNLLIKFYNILFLYFIDDNNIFQDNFLYLYFYLINLKDNHFHLHQQNE